MAGKQTRTAAEIGEAKTRFVVGSKKATYVNGKSKMAMPTLDYEAAKATIAYYEKMNMGETVAFELVPIEISEDGSVTRQT